MFSSIISGSVLGLNHAANQALHNYFREKEVNLRVVVGSYPFQIARFSSLLFHQKMLTQTFPILHTLKWNQIHLRSVFNSFFPITLSSLLVGGGGLFLKQKDLNDYPWINRTIHLFYDFTRELARTAAVVTALALMMTGSFAMGAAMGTVLVGGYLCEKKIVPSKVGKKVLPTIVCASLLARFFFGTPLEKISAGIDATFLMAHFF